MTLTRRQKVLAILVRCAEEGTTVDALATELRLTENSVYVTLSSMLKDRLARREQESRGKRARWYEYVDPQTEMIRNLDRITRRWAELRAQDEQCEEA